MCCLFSPRIKKNGDKINSSHFGTLLSLDILIATAIFFVFLMGQDLSFYPEHFDPSLLV